MKIIGTGSALPRKTVTNAMLSEFLDTSDEWIVPRTGIRSRHVISSEKIEDLASEAALKAMEMAGVGPGDIDYFICSNVVSEYVTPSLSCIVSEKTGLACPAVDINCACPGFVYALDIAEAQYKAGRIRKALIVCAEQPTRMCDWSDRSTCVLFGDGAAAVVLGEGDNVLGIRLKSQPDSRKIWQRQSMQPTPYYQGDNTPTALQMMGREVFKFAVSASTTEVEALLREIGMSKDDVNWYMVHQANKRILDAIQQYLGEEQAKFPSNIEDHGNSSSASCPILLDECNRKGMFERGQIMVFSAFGAGLLSGAAVLRW